jgi:holin-like protein
MGFFFLPLAVSVLQHYQVISPALFQIIAICVISTLVTFAVSYGVVRFFRIVMGDGEGAPSKRRRFCKPAPGDSSL